MSIIIISCQQPGSAQNIPGNDSLNAVLYKTKNPDNKVDIIIEFLEKPEMLYLEDGIVLANRAYQIANQNNYAKGKVKSMLKMSQYYFRSSDYKKAMEFAQKSREMSEDMNFDKELASSLSQIGSIYNELGDYDNSSQYFFKSLRLYEALEDKEGISHSLGNIGMDFFNQQDHEKALEYFNNALSIAKKINDLSGIKRQYNNIAVVYSDLQKYDTAIDILRKAIEINVKLGDKLGKGRNIMNIGYGQMNQGKYSDALKSFQQSLDLFTELNNRMHIAECNINFGFCHYTTERIDESIVYFKEALRVGQENNYHRIIYAASEILNQIYTEKKDTLNAYKYVMLEKASGDSLFASQKQKLLSKLELQYIYEKKEFKRQLDQQVKNTIMLIIIIGLVSGLIILGLIFSRHRLRSRFLVLEKEKIESELDIKNRELTVNLILLIKKNEMLSDISDKLVELEHNAKSLEAKEVIIKISQEMRNRTDDKMLNEFTQRFQEVHAGFYEKILKTYPDLTQNELKLCAFLRLNMSTKDISELTGQQFSTIDQARYRLRKKLGISNSETNLVTFLSQI
ncbi:MAG: tetratricopeptide repeat protein [Bacteroidota bacterium]